MASVTDTYPLPWSLGLAILLTTQPVKDSIGDVIPPASIVAYITELQNNLAASQTALNMVQAQLTTVQTSNTNMTTALNAALPAVQASVANGHRFKVPAVNPTLPPNLLDPTVPNHMHPERVLSMILGVLGQ